MPYIYPKPSEIEMTIIAAKRDNKIYYGSIPKIAKLIEVHPETIKRWIKAKEEMKFKNGYEIYFKTEKLK